MCSTQVAQGGTPSKPTQCVRCCSPPHLLQVLTSRLATVFATLREMPAIRFRAATPPGEEFPPGLESRLLVAQRIAVELHERLAALQRAGQLPERETCELILTDRGFDPVAPIIHEWTYEAMAFDLLAGSQSLKENVFEYDVETQGGGWQEFCCWREGQAGGLMVLCWGRKGGPQ